MTEKITYRLMLGLDYWTFAPEFVFQMITDKLQI